MCKKIPTVAKKFYLQGEDEKAISVFSIIDNILLLRTEPQIANYALELMLHKSSLQADIGNIREAIKTVNQIETEYSKTQNDMLVEIIAGALTNKSIFLMDLEEYDEALETVEKVLCNFSSKLDFKNSEAAAKAILTKGLLLNRLQIHNASNKALDEAIRMHKHSDNTQIRQTVVKAYAAKINRLVDTLNFESANSLINSVVLEYGNFKDDSIIDCIVGTKINMILCTSESKTDPIAERIAGLESLLKEYPINEIPDTQAKSILLYNICEGYLELEDMNLVKMYANVLVNFSSNMESETLEAHATGALYLATAAWRINDEPEARRWGNALEENCQRLEHKGNLSNWLAFFRKNHASVTGRNSLSLLSIHSTVLSQLKGNEIGYLKQMSDRENTMRQFLVQGDSNWKGELSFLLVLREWNSYTPALPSQDEADRGGGYFIFHKGAGIVIDPGYDFIYHFEKSGGKLEDITHIVITHAHDDHTAELESLLMLLNKYNEMLRDDASDDYFEPKKISLFLNLGAQRKFSGLINLKHQYIFRCVTLSRPDPDETPATHKLADGLFMTPLPAHHDDVITENSAVGLYFQFTFGNDTRNVVFTSDSGLYPILHDIDSATGERKLDYSPDKALYNTYKPILKDNNIDLLVAHIGSIKAREFQSYTPGDEGWRWYYPKHLGILGTVTMLHALKPSVAIISEFGSELRDIRNTLINVIVNTLDQIQKKDNLPNSEHSFVCPGDLSIIYNIETNEFCCHTLKKFLFKPVSKLNLWGCPS